MTLTRPVCSLYVLIEEDGRATIEIIIGLPVPLPLLRTPVKAGFPSPADDFVEEEIDLQRMLISNRPATNMFWVAGDNMIGKKLHDGDLAIVDRSLSPKAGDVVVVDIDGERSFKVWAPRRGPVRIRLREPALPRVRDPSDAVVEVWGVVSSSISPRRRAHR